MFVQHLRLSRTELTLLHLLQTPTFTDQLLSQKSKLPKEKDSTPRSLSSTLIPTETNLNPSSTRGELEDPLPSLARDFSSDSASRPPSKFAWLPSIFRVSPSGDSTRIISYINNLGPRSSHPSLYKAIEHLFTIALPMIQQSLDEKLELVDTPSFQRWEERASTTGDNWTGKEGQKLSEWRALLMEQKRQEREDRKFARKVSEFQPSEKGLRGPLDLKGKDLKVIVKVSLGWERRTTRFFSSRRGRTSRLLSSLTGRRISSQTRTGLLGVLAHRRSCSFTSSVSILSPSTRPHSAFLTPPPQPHEMIASSFIYYYSTSKEIEDDGLALRRVRLDVDPPNEEENHGVSLLFSLFSLRPR